jgi:acetyl esterase
VAFIHGGGWVAGDLDTHDALCRALAAAGEAVVASVDYRRAPEHRFPAALDDAYAVLQQFAAEAPRWGVDARRIAVAGDSAGGNLAAAVCLMARDRGKHVPAQQLLIYPIVSAEFSTPSYARYEDGYVLTRRAMEWFWDQYAPAIADRAHPYATPLHADLAGLPPALVVTAGHDVLCSEGAAYAERLAASGTPAEYFDYPGMLHGFLHRLSMFDDARDLVARLGRFLQAL